MNGREFEIEKKEIMNSREFQESRYKGKYMNWLIEASKNPHLYHKTIHNVKYRLGILRTQIEKRESNEL